MLAFFMPSGLEFLMFAALFLLLFGGKRIPGLMRSMGSSIVEFKKGISGAEDDPNQNDSV
ncbi:MAG: twin-arginine translocase TatA/TatE family subunit [Planctomycetaceae bacterium]|jgi:sec-independent protein translocase protein TatA